jgi:putative phosphoribosyl transferase
VGVTGPGERRVVPPTHAGRRFRDRVEAGEALADAVAERYGEGGTAADRRPVTVLALPRGGVPVAYPVARRIGAPLDVLVVRKLGVPGQPELAMGAIAPGGVLVIDDDVVRRMGISTGAVEQVIERERAELVRREAVFRGGRPPLDVAGRTVVLVDDGIATGATTRASVRAARAMGPAQVVVAAPTASRQAVEGLARVADDVVVVDVPDPYLSVGWWYEAFTQTSDDEVTALLARAADD